MNRFKTSSSLSKGLLFFLTSFLSAALVFGQDALEQIEQEQGIRKVKVETKSFSKGLAGQKDALEKAHVEALNIWYEIQGIRDKKEVFAKRLASHSKEYVLSERVLNVSNEFDGVQLEVEVYLDEALLRFDLASFLFPELQPKPTIAFIISENLAGHTGVLVNSGDSYAMLKKLFEETGFNSSADLERSGEVQPTQNELIAFLNQGAAGILRYAKMTRSDIIVAGLVKTYAVDPINTGEEAKIRPLRAEAQLQVIRVSDGKIFQLLRAEAELKSPDLIGGSKVVAHDAVYKVQREALISAVIASLSMPDMSNQYRLKVEGEGVGMVWKTLTKELSSYSGLTRFQSIYARPAMSEAQFSFDGSVSALVDKLGEFKYAGYRLEPRMIAGQEIEFKLVLVDNL
jgi:hypothetical protein